MLIRERGANELQITQDYRIGLYKVTPLIIYKRENLDVDTFRSPSFINVLKIANFIALAKPSNLHNVKKQCYNGCD